MATNTRLKACLYSFISPGGPTYPTRVVHHAAWDALDLLFPVGRYPRHLISLLIGIPIMVIPPSYSSMCFSSTATCIVRSNSIKVPIKIHEFTQISAPTFSSFSHQPNRKQPIFFFR
ncbi:hypothetical protein C1H46_002532 [Malus baccata]|uniref:Uncharacterized protein n=1 Tax=Malus baccata TaxID=106549 RepID=A0A540NLK8_MALBA|nr:hypothetical protein C1H46_002532 [Malus baccata]